MRVYKVNLFYCKILQSQYIYCYHLNHTVYLQQTKGEDVSRFQSDIQSPNLIKALPTGNIEVSHSEGVNIQEIAEFASRYNNKRHFLIASKLLGKYIPARPSTVAMTQKKLAEKMHCINHKTLFLGFAESCSGFGEGVFEQVMAMHPAIADKSSYIHTTRQFDEEKHSIAVAFKEEHSHAVNQVILMPEDDLIKDTFCNAETVVLIEDEITTGNTIKNFLNEYIQHINPHLKRVVILTILDIRTLSHKADLALSFPDIQIMSHSLCSASLRFYKTRDNDIFIPKAVYKSNSLETVLTTGRIGLLPKNKCFDKHLETLKSLDPNTPITVIGTSEYTGLARDIGLQLEKCGYDVEMLCTTRAPLQVGNAIKVKYTFGDHYGDGIEHYLYNFDTKRHPVFFYENKQQANIHKDLHDALQATVITGDE